MSEKSQVPEGYRKTEVGITPEDWGIEKLGSLCELITKGTTPTTLGFSYQNTGINFIKIETINANGNFLPSLFSHISEDANRALKRSILKENDLLFSIAGALGRVAIVSPEILPANINQALAIIRLKRDQKIDLKYMYFFLKGFQIQKHIDRINVQSAQANLSLENINNFKIVLPQKEEQQKIATILSKVDEQIKQTEQIIEKTEILKKGLMQKMFTKGIGHTKFKKTELGEIPEEWEIRGLTKIFNIIDYRGRTPAFSDNGIPYIGADNIKDARIVFNKRRYVSEETYIEYMTRGIPNPGDILFTTEAPLGNVAQVPRYKFCFAQRVVVFQCKNNFSPLFFMYLLKNKIMQKQFLNWATGTTVTGISSKNMKFIKLYYPKSIQEQERIGQALKSVDKYIDLEKNKLSHLQELKKGLMQDLLTGKIRVCA